MTAPASDDGWIEWAGGECPVDLSKKVDVRISAPRSATLFDVSARLLHSGDPAWSNWFRRGYNDIEAYRVVPS